ncbi:hypothetical protein AA0N74_14410 [Chromobacterium vaccinii]|uniref:hypothetical protein n=1 Tax=Chromobacterium vaccinii TaxID=1108595 RepID=UPI0031D52AFC
MTKSHKEHLTMAFSETSTSIHKRPEIVPSSLMEEVEPFEPLTLEQMEQLYANGVSSPEIESFDD